LKTPGLYTSNVYKKQNLIKTLENDYIQFNNTVYTRL